MSKVIRAAEQQKLHRIFHLFESYVTTHPAFTIHFFPGTGYLCLENDFGTDNEVFRTADDMLTSIIDEVIMDVASIPHSPEHIDNQLSEREKNQIRQRLDEITQHFSKKDKDECFALLEREIETYPWNPLCKSQREIHSQR